MKVVVFLALACLAAGLDNGLARTPPLGWRSWNAYGGGVTQAKMEGAVAAMTDRSRSVVGRPGRSTSLLDLGYAYVGLDDGWQKCGAGVNGSFHDAAGNPIVDEAKFPDMASMVRTAHGAGMRAGWYFNNCICAERAFGPAMADAVYRGSVAALRRYRFDGLKLDSCSQFNNLSMWNALLNASGGGAAAPANLNAGGAVLVENCHQGGLDPGQRQWQTWMRGSSGSSGSSGSGSGSGGSGGRCIYPWIGRSSTLRQGVGRHVGHQIDRCHPR